MQTEDPGISFTYKTMALCVKPCAVDMLNNDRKQDGELYCKFATHKPTET